MGGESETMSTGNIAAITDISSRYAFRGELLPSWEVWPILLFSAGESQSSSDACHTHEEDERMKAAMKLKIR
jgi:hypothetical protein